ncbi:MAG: protein-glutamate O-methyltransferase CheR [candidate division KSB1 bacterium]|nr:protein-glutamate O-methyltransferase CheR [candidate division KSB1 bacterium]MDQ7063645.1 protein-glutamate O-methyltransferase CheR [candidate division KSB1 bacterium]
MQDIADFIYEMSGIVIDLQKKYFVESRLKQLLPQIGLKNAEELCDALKNFRDPKLETFLIDAFTTHETYWFRDPELFSALASIYFPSFKEFNAGRPFLIWSAACSTGQEPYSIVMLLLENHFISNLAGRVVATDISLNALNRASKGIYNQIEMSRGIPAEFLIKYFWQMNGGSWQISESVRRYVEFAQQNLLTDPIPYSCQYHLIFCRNVLIYFLKQDKEKVLKKIYHRLAPMGLLVLGASETTVGISKQFCPLRLGKAMVFCRAEDYSRWTKILGK